MLLQMLPPLSSSCIGSLECRCLRQPMLTKLHDFDKTEIVSAIGLDNRRLSPVTRLTRFFGYAQKAFTTRPAQDPYRCATEPRAHFGSREGSLHSVRRRRQLGRDRQTSRRGAGNLVPAFPNPRHAD